MSSGLFGGFSNSQSDSGSGLFDPFSDGSTESVPTRNGTPNQYRFELVRVYKQDSCVAVLARYPDCENHNGRKIMVFDDREKWEREVEQADQPTMDPHFLEEGLVPVARFEPTERGWKLALNLTDRLT